MQFVKYAIIVRSTDQIVLIEGSIFSQSDDFKKEAKKIVPRFFQSNLNPDERKKIISKKNGHWICVCDRDMLLYIAQVDPEFPERMSYAFLNELRRGLIQDVSKYISECPEYIKEEFGCCFKELMEKYNDPSAIDELSSIQKKLYDATGLMLQNIECCLANNAEIHYMEQQTKAVREDAEVFEREAQELKDQIDARNLKIKLCFGAFAFSTGFCVALPVIENLIKQK